MTAHKLQLCLWHPGTALEAATFYAETFPDSHVLQDALSHPDRAAAGRAFAAMMTMHKIDVAAIEAALAGPGA